MSFIAAILHAAIGYGIRRKSWPEGLALHLDNLRELRWLQDKRFLFTVGEPICPFFYRQPIPLSDGSFDDWYIGEQEINATDWETI